MLSIIFTHYNIVKIIEMPCARQNCAQLRTHCFLSIKKKNTPLNRFYQLIVGIGIKTEFLNYCPSLFLHVFKMQKLTNINKYFKFFTRLFIIVLLFLLDFKLKIKTSNHRVNLRTYQLPYLFAATTGKSPKLKPYPNWEAQNYRENNGVGKLASVFRMHVDICDRLWMLDTGLVNILVKPDMVYMPKIVVYDLKNDQLLLEFTIPQDVVKQTTFFANIISDVKDSCENTYAYMADIGSYAIAVYHLATNRIWRVTHSFFYFEPTKGDYNIGKLYLYQSNRTYPQEVFQKQIFSGGINFQWRDGVFGLALSGGIDECCHKMLYFHAVSGTKQFAVSTEIIQNETIASTNYHAYKELGDRGDHGHSTGCSFHEPSSVLFFTLISKNAVGCWNSKNTEYSSRTLGIVASDNITMNYPNDLKVDKKGVLWVLTDRLINFWYDHLDYNDVNFRIFSAPVAEAIKGTVCEHRSS